MRPAWRAAFAAAVLAGLAAPSAAQVRNWPSESAPKPLASRRVAFPAYEVRTLPNGLRVVVVEQHEQPSVSLRLLIGAGSARDVAPKFGVANMVASLLDQGTTTRTAQQIAETVDTIGGDVAVGAGTDVTFAYVTVLKDSVGVGLELLSDIVQAPAFAQVELDRQRERLRSALRVDYQDPDYLASLVFKRLVYGFHPYGYPGTGTPESIERITRNDLVEFHARHFVPNNGILAIVGDVSAPEAFAAAERIFSGWPRRDLAAPMVLQPPQPTRRVVVVDMPDAVQTEIRVGQLGIRRKVDDYLVVDLAVRILGGEGANRLQQVLRTQRGLTYGASADLNAFRLTGDIVAETNTRSVATAEALRVMVDEVFRLQRESAREKELDDAKAYLAGSYPLSIETPDDIATKVLTALFYELPLKDLETFRERVNAVTPEDIARVTRAYLRPDRLSIVLAGNAAAFLNELERVGFRNVEVVPAGDLDVATADLRRRPGVRPALAPRTAPGVSREEWERAKAEIVRATAASGGLEALRGVKTIRATARTVMQTPRGPMRATTRTYVEYPGRMRIDAMMPSGDVVQAYADGKAWLKDSTGVRDAPAPMRDEFAQGLRRDWIVLFLAASDDRVFGRLLPDDKGLAGRPLRVVELWSDTLLPVRIALDVETGLMAWMSYESSGPRGRVTVRESFDDYRAVNGIRIPQTAVIRRDGEVMLERTLNDVQVNVTFPPTFFQKIQ